MKKAIILFLILSSVQTWAQHKIGVRAGLNRSTFAASDLEAGENYGWSGGFHFGVNYTYKFTPVVGLRAELVYTQRGARYSYEDSSSYTVIKPIDNSIPQFFDFGNTELEMDYSNGYLSIPVTAQIQLNKKWELFGGMSLDMLINPTGRGNLDYRSASKPDEIFFRKSYDHHYRSDTLGEVSFLSRTTTSIILDGDPTQLRRTETAYFNLQPGEKMGNKFRFVDFHIILGFNYFLNNGFYVGLRGEYGLLDITNDDMDFTLKSLNADNTYIRRRDKDYSRSLSVSFGFRF